ncbi:hypothetical protein C2G38_2154897 [Gigaspora rosea]|uniref:Uncharacterized protein n=1 Tax=Gigaspora rosea TaxID=44941 RepID=A0A397W7V0_9GLOM|nr:hypothetical protein C2G38_2154897 [Gigaspora rosea]
MTSTEVISHQESDTGKTVKGKKNNNNKVEPGKQNPIWQVSSKKIAKIFDGANRTETSETETGELNDMTFGEEGPPTWPSESYQRKRTYVIKVGTRGEKNHNGTNAG